MSGMSGRKVAVIFAIYCLPPISFLHRFGILLVTDQDAVASSKSAKVFMSVGILFRER